MMVKPYAGMLAVFAAQKPGGGSAGGESEGEGEGQR
jgi:hypothetical protein